MCYIDFSALYYRYVQEDLHRVAEYYNVAFKPPADVFNVMVNKGSLKAQRLLTVTRVNNPDYLETLSLQLFRRVWLTNEDVTEDSSLQEACHDSNIPAELADRFVAMTQSAEIKNELTRVTSEAVQMGVFGAPFFAIHHNGKENMLFGSDRMFLLAHYLGECWPPSFDHH